MEVFSEKQEVKQPAFSRLRRFFWFWFDHRLDISYAHQSKNKCWYWYNTPCWEKHLRTKKYNKDEKERRRNLKRAAR